MDIFNEILWPQFIQLNKVRTLPLNEQVKKYNQYIYELNEARHSWVSYQNKGPFRLPLTIQNVSYLLQENGFEILQENGYKIIIT